MVVPVDAEDVLMLLVPAAESAWPALAGGRDGLLEKATDGFSPETRDDKPSLRSEGGCRRDVQGLVPHEASDVLAGRLRARARSFCCAGCPGRR